MSIILFPYARSVQCDHGLRLNEECQRCEHLRVWVGIRNALAVSIAFWGIVGLVLIWWVR